MANFSTVVSLALGLACTLSAAPVTWHLKGATFSDGGWAVGSLTYDADTNTYSNVKIYTTPGTDVRAASSDTLRAGRDFTVVNTAFGAATNRRVRIQQAGPTIKLQSGILNLEVATPLSNAGGSVLISSASSENWWVDNGGVLAGPTRVITAGKLVATPGTGPQRWYLDGVTLDDGAGVIGSFVFDATTKTYSEMQLQSTRGSTFSGANFTAAFAVATFNTPIATAGNLAATAGATPTAGGRVINLVFDAALTNAPGSVQVTTSTNKSAEGSCSSVTCSANGAVTFASIVRNVVSGVVTTSPPAGYSKVIPHFVDGGKPAWQSVIVLSNLSDGPSPFTARFFDNNGAPLVVPGIGSVTTGLVPARGVVFLRSSGTAATTIEGWTRVGNAHNLSVSNQLVLKAANSGGDQQGVMYGDVLGSTVVSVPFDSTLSAINGFAVVNPDPLRSVTLLMVGYDVNGNIIASDAGIVLKPLGHSAFIFSAQIRL